MNITRLNWDSDFFGLRIGRVEIMTKEDGKVLSNQASTLCNEYDLLYVFAPHNLEFPASGATLVDEKVRYKKDRDIKGLFNPQIILWDDVNGVTSNLKHLALESGCYSRFKLDKGFSPGSYERLYSRWIEQSVDHSIASEVFCYMVDGVPKGLITMNRNNEEGVIGLVAVHEENKNHGIGSEMMQHVFKYAEHKRLRSLSVATQLNNHPACKFYEKNGFMIESITDVWHWWL